MAEQNGGDKPSDLENKIIRQVEYYFGDVNLPRDRFLQEKIKEDDGWVTMDTMLNFNRLRSLSADKEFICAALRKSGSGLLEVSEDSTKVRRSPSKPLPDNTKERKDELQARTYYVKPFPLDITLDTLTEFFEKYGKVESILMRRGGKPERLFKGSVFVVFANKEDGDKFVALENVQYDSNDLIRMMKDDYFKKKADEAKQQKAAKDDGEKTKEEEGKKLEESITKGSILFVKGLPEEVNRDEIKTFFAQFGNVAWVEFTKGEDKALLRVHEGKAQALLDTAKEKGEGKIVWKDKELEARVLEGEEELDYWRKMFRDLSDRKQFRKQQNRRKMGGGKFGGKFGGRQGKRKGSSDEGGGAKEAKKAKVESADGE